MDTAQPVHISKADVPDRFEGQNTSLCCTRQCYYVSKSKYNIHGVPILLPRTLWMDPTLMHILLCTRILKIISRPTGSCFKEWHPVGWKKRAFRSNCLHTYQLRNSLSHIILETIIWAEICHNCFLLRINLNLLLLAEMSDGIASF